MNKLTLYFRQALHMMKEEKLFSGIYIAGTALAMAFTMVIVMAYNFKIAPVYPEVNRAKTFYLDGIVNVNPTTGVRQECGGVAQMIIDQLKELPSVEQVGTTLNFNPELFVQKPDGDDEPIYMQFVDDGFFKVYQFDFIEGRPFTHEEWLDNMNRLVLTDQMAKKVFGTMEGLVGKTLTIDYEEFTICGIVRTANVVSFMSYADAYTGGDHQHGYWGDPWGKGSIKAVILTDDAEALRKDINQMYTQLSRELKERDEEWEIAPLTNELISHHQMALSTHAC